MPAPASLGGLGGGPFGAWTCGEVPGGEGWTCGVTLSFWPGSGSSPANSKTTTPRTAMMIHVLRGLREFLELSAMPRCSRSIWTMISSKCDAARDGADGQRAPIECPGCMEVVKITAQTDAVSCRA